MPKKLQALMVLIDHRYPQNVATVSPLSKVELESAPVQSENALGK